MNTIRFAALGGTIALILASPGGTLAKTPNYTVAPGTPVCTVGAPDNTIVCGWTTAGLSPSPAKFAVEVIVSYDPDCDDDFDLSKTFRFDTPDGDTSFDVLASALDTTICTSGDTPCTVPATYHAKSVQVRVKAVNPPSRQGSQNNPFSGLSTAGEIPGVCGVACPQVCVDGINSWLAQVPASAATIRFECSYDPVREAGIILAQVFHSVLHEAQIGSSTCIAYTRDFENPDAVIVNIGLTFPQQAACATLLAPTFVSRFNRPCDFSPP